MSQATTEKMPSKLLTVEPRERDMLQEMADTLMEQATQARASGNKEAAAKLLRAAANIMDDNAVDLDDSPRRYSRSDKPDGRKQTTPETEKIKDMLRKGWTEAHEMQEATGLNANRVHSLLGRLKNSRELKFEKRTIVQYRLLP